MAAVASGRSAGAEVSFGEKPTLKVRSLDTFDFTGWDIGLFSPGASVSAVHAPRAAAAGCIVIDNTSQFRMEPDVPLVVPEVNPHASREVRAPQHHRQSELLHDPDGRRAEAAARSFQDQRVVVATYQSVSGAGKEGMDELFNQTKAAFVHEQVTAGAVHQGDRLQLHPAYRQVHGRRVDQGRVEDGGRDHENSRPRHPRASLPAYACRCSSAMREAVNVEFENPITVGEARAVLRDAPGIAVMDQREDGGYITPAECRGRGRGVYQPHPQGPDRRERSRVLVRRPTICAKVRR